MKKRLLGRNGHHHGLNGSAALASQRIAQFLSAAPLPRPAAIERPGDGLDRAIERGVEQLYRLQQPDGHWVARMDSNSGINAEYIMTMHYLGLVDEEQQRRLARFIHETQNEDGSWPIYVGGPGNLSVTIVCYYGLKIAGHDPREPALARAREWVLAHGGLMAAKFECKFLMCLFGQFPWRGLAHIPVYLLLAPGWFTFAPRNISYWARCCLVPMAMLYERKATIDPPVGCAELYAEAEAERDYAPNAGFKTISWENFFIRGGQLLKLFERCTLGLFNRLGFRAALDWVRKHQEDAGDWGGIYPAMMYSLMALKAAGYPADHPALSRGWAALLRFEAGEGEELMMQACVSPVWDTCWSVLTLEETGQGDPQRIAPARGFLYDHQIFREGDWSAAWPEGRPGGWCFQYHNDHYPDLDDSAVVLMSLMPRLESDDARRRECFEIGVHWLLGLQNDDGGWAAFDKNLDRELINHLPFNDIYNMLDPSTADLTGRVLELLGRLGMTAADRPVARGRAWLVAHQESFGAWYGRWGVNYVYGTWSVLCGLAATAEDMTQEYVRRAVAWLESVQNEDGGWGESCRSYDDPAWAGKGDSTPSQTAWGLLALCAAGDAGSPAAARAARHLIETQQREGGWEERHYTGTGFPGAFYLRYYMYAMYFPLQALARYRKLAGAADRAPATACYVS